MGEREVRFGQSIFRFSYGTSAEQGPNSNHLHLLVAPSQHQQDPLYSTLNWQQSVTMQPTATLKLFQPTRRMMAMPVSCGLRVLPNLRLTKPVNRTRSIAVRSSKQSLNGWVMGWRDAVHSIGILGSWIRKQRLIYWHCSSHYLSTTTNTAKDSSRVDPPW